MKKSSLFIMMLALTGLTFFSSCDETTESNAPILNVLSTTASGGTAIEGTMYTITVSVGENATSKKNLQTLDVDADGTANDTLHTFPNGTTTGTLTFEFIAPAAGQTDDVVFTLTDKAGETASETVQVTGATSGTAFGTEVTGAYYHISGSLQGAYDLVAETTLSSSDPAAGKDMENSDMAGATFTGSWAAANTTTFVKANSFDYDAGTKEEAETAFNAGTAFGIVTNPAANDIYIAKLRNGSDYALVKITSVDATDNTCNCGNTGKMSFDFKK